MQVTKDSIPYIMMGIGNLGMMALIWQGGWSQQIEASLFWIVICDVGAITLLVMERYGSIKCK
jgi:hypothetical protein